MSIILLLTKSIHFDIILLAMDTKSRRNSPGIYNV